MPGAAEALRGWPGGTSSWPRFWKPAAQENPLAAFVSAAAPVGEFDVVTRGGDYFRVFRLQGLAFVGADPNLSHRADRILSQGWGPAFRGPAVDKCRSVLAL